MKVTNHTELWDVSRPDTFLALLTVWGTASESTILVLSDLIVEVLTTRAKVPELYCNQPRLHLLHKNLSLLLKLIKHEYFARSPTLLSNHTQSEAMHNVSAHQGPRYYQPQQVSTTAWIVPVTWYTHRKPLLTKILQNFWLTLEIYAPQTTTY